MSRLLTATFALLMSGVSLCHADSFPVQKKTLTAFRNDAELKSYLQGYLESQRAIRRFLPFAQAAAGDSAVMPSMAPPTAPAPSARAAAPVGAVAASDAVTNNQSAGVDEGGIVKVHGKHLVILRRGRLFTVDIGNSQLAPVASVNAFAPGSEPSGSWYDEMLIVDDTVVVIGYSYSRGGTEIGLFDIDAAGGLAYRATYHMKSDDYYSGRNYASRQLGTKLVFYTPLALNLWQPDLFESFPAVRRWDSAMPAAPFHRIAPASRIYRTDNPLEPGAGLTLHTVTLCDLATREMACQASAVLDRPVAYFMYRRSRYMCGPAPAVMARAALPPVPPGCSACRSTAAHRAP